MTLRLHDLPAGWVACPPREADPAWSARATEALLGDQADEGVAAAVRASFDRGAAAASTASVLQRRFPRALAHAQLTMREWRVDADSPKEFDILPAEDPARIAPPVVAPLSSASLGDGVEARCVARVQAGDDSVDLAEFRYVFAAPGTIVTVQLEPTLLPIAGFVVSEVHALLDRLEVVDVEGERPDLDIAGQCARWARAESWESLKGAQILEVRATA